MNKEDLEKYECPICKNKAYSWGTLFEMRFVDEESPTFSKYLKGGDYKLARRCKICGNIQIFE